jgi:hypothetical protein
MEPWATAARRIPPSGSQMRCLIAQILREFSRHPKAAQALGIRTQHLHGTLRWPCFLQNLS